MSQIRAAKAFVELSLRQSAFTKGLRNAERSLAKTGSKIRGLGQGLLGAGGAGIGLFTAAVSGASDLQESISKTNEVFGDSSDIVTKFAADAANAFGLSKKAANAYASEIGLLLLKTGSTEKEAASLSVQMVKLAADIASFNNISNDEALTKLKAGLVGSSEPLRSVGVLLSAAAVEAKAAELGLEKLNGKFTEGAKVAARYALITEQTKKTQGDFSRTSNGFANINRRLFATMQNIADSIGSAVLPIYEEFSRQILSVTSVIGDFAKENQSLIRNIFLVVTGVTVAGAALIAVGSAFGLASFAVGGLAAAWGAILSAASVMLSVLGTVGSVVAALVSPFGAVVVGVGILIGAFLTMTSAGEAVVNWFTSNFNKIFSAVSETMGGIFEALKAGDLGLAAEIGFTGVKLAIGIILDEIENLFGVSFEGMFSTIAQFGKSIATVLAQLNVARTKVSNFLAEQIALSDQVVSFISGVDVKADRERAKKSNELAARLGAAQQEISVGSTLKEDNARSVKDAEGAVDAAKSFKPQEFGKSLRDSFNPEDLKKKLEDLRKTARTKVKNPIAEGVDSAIKKVEAVKFDSLKDGIAGGQKKIESQGSFIGAAAAQSGGGSLSARMFEIQKQQLEFQKKKEAAKVKRDSKLIKAVRESQSKEKTRV